LVLRSTFPIATSILIVDSSNTWQGYGLWKKCILQRVCFTKKIFGKTFSFMLTKNTLWISWKYFKKKFQWNQREHIGYTIGSLILDKHGINWNRNLIGLELLIFRREQINFLVIGRWAASLKKLSSNQIQLRTKWLYESNRKMSAKDLIVEEKLENDLARKHTLPHALWSWHCTHFSEEVCLVVYLYVAGRLRIKHLLINMHQSSS